jgi:F-type H+-transporting ATPase subunit a
MGPRGREFAPFTTSFFLYIVIMNLMGLIPGLKSGTASLSITLGLAIVAFLTVQYYGFRTHGLRYLLHFAGPVWWLAWLILPIELLSECIRIVSLSVRLYGNIFGEEQIITALAGMGVWVPVLLLPLQLLTCLLQAYVFTLLFTVYISLATERHGSEHGVEPVPTH